MTLAVFLAFLIYSACGQYKAPVKAGAYLDDLICILDPRINATTLTSYRNGLYKKQIGKYLWQTACPRARGIFTLAQKSDEYSGFTYSCSHWPKEWGINQISDWFKNPSDYEKHLQYLSLWLQGIYNTTAVKEMATCDFRGFTTLRCPTVPDRDPYQAALATPWAQKIGNKPFRGVNLGGLFVLEPWITPNFTNWSLTLDDQYKYSQQFPAGSQGYQILVDLWTKWYSPEDFKLMKQYGLNSVRLPTGWWYWAKDAGVDNPVYTVPNQSTSDPTHPITQVIKWAKDAGLVLILDLHGVPGSQNGLDNSGHRSNDTNPARWGYQWFYDKKNLQDSTKILVAMAKYITTLQGMGIDNVIALELVNEPWVFGDMAIVRNFYVDTISAVRQVSQIPIVIHDAFRHAEWEWLLNNFPFQNIYMDTHLYHAFNADDIASSNISCDKNKIIVAQNIACGYGSLLRFKTCTSVPTFVGEWSLANDDCVGMIRGAQYSVQNKDYGQCKHLKERVGDPWWIQHYRDFFYKQAAMAERELGWFFWTWKLGPGTEKDPSQAYWSYSGAVKAGIIPDTLHDSNITEACYEFMDTFPFTC